MLKAHHHISIRLKKALNQPFDPVTQAARHDGGYVVTKSNVNSTTEIQHIHGQYLLKNGRLRTSMAINMVGM